MSDEKKSIKYGVDELTVSINRKKAEDKTEDWHSDFDGKIVINGDLYYLNLYDHFENGEWLKGKAVKAKPQNGTAPPAPASTPAPAVQENLDDDIPF